VTLIALPKRAPGRKSAEKEAAEIAADLQLCQWLEDHCHASGFAFGTRGWAYVAEGAGIITKGQFDAFETWLTRVRKDGLLDPDVVSDDDARSTDGIEDVDLDDPAAYARQILDRAHSWLRAYTPISVWKGLGTYVELLVEKVDLKIIFGPVCARYSVPITNGKGSADLNLRRHMLGRFRDQYKESRKLVLLYFGDLDPFGQLIADVIKSNLMECARVQRVDFDPTPIYVERIGLTAAQIAALGLPWIENLETGSGKDLANPRHPDHNKLYVQTHIATYGPRKVEATALAAHPAEAQALIEAAINRYIPPDWPQRHHDRLRSPRQQAYVAFEALIGSPPQDGQNEEGMDQ
jgi:hypothetical protein